MKQLLCDKMKLKECDFAQVKLTFQVPKIIGPTSCSSTSGGSSRLPAYHNLSLLVTGRDIYGVQQQLLQHSCVALYLTLSSAEEKTPHVSRQKM